MKKLVRSLSFLPVLAMTIMFACNNSNKNEMADEKNAENANEDKYKGQAEDDANLVAFIAGVSLKEVQLGQLAQQKAMMDHTKQLAQMLVTDHQKSYDDMAALAKAKNITIPAAISDADKNEYDNLANDKAEDFDKDYCDKMVNGHKDVIDKLKNEMNEIKDPDLKQWVTNAMPTLQHHLDEAQKCQEECKNMEKKM